MTLLKPVNETSNQLGNARVGQTTLGVTKTPFPAYIPKIGSGKDYDAVVGGQTMEYAIEGMAFDLTALPPPLEGNVVPGQAMIEGGLAQTEYRQFLEERLIIIDPHLEGLYSSKDPAFDRLLRVQRPSMPTSIRRLFKGVVPETYQAKLREMLEDEQTLSYSTWFFRLQTAREASLAIPATPVFDGGSEFGLELATTITAQTRVLAQANRASFGGAAYLALKPRTFYSMSSVNQALSYYAAAGETCGYYLFKLLNFESLHGGKSPTRKNLRFFVEALVELARTRDGVVGQLDAGNEALPFTMLGMDFSTEGLSGSPGYRRGTTGRVPTPYGGYYDPLSRETIPWDTVQELYVNGDQTLPCALSCCGGASGNQIPADPDAWNAMRRIHLFNWRNSELSDAREWIIQKNTTAARQRLAKAGNKNFLDYLPD
jgi:hypothetical protein